MGEQGGVQVSSKPNCGRLRSGLLVLLVSFPAVARAALPAVQNSANCTHTIVNGRPILFLGDTCWLMQQNMDKEAIREYLDHRKAQGFNAIGIQMDFGWSKGGRDVNGNCPYLNPNGTALHPGYWEYTSWIVDQAAQRGMYVFFKASAMEVRDYKWCMGGTGITTPNDAYTHGRLLGEWFGRRGQMSNIVWMMSYDRTISAVSPEAARVRAQAEASPMAIMPSMSSTARRITARFS